MALPYGPGDSGARPSIIVAALLEVLDDVRDLLDEANRLEDQTASTELRRLLVEVATSIDRCHRAPEGKSIDT